MAREFENAKHPEHSEGDKGPRHLGDRFEDCSQKKGVDDDNDDDDDNNDDDDDDDDANNDDDDNNDDDNDAYRQNKGKGGGGGVAECRREKAEKGVPSPYQDHLRIMNDDDHDDGHDDHDDDCQSPHYHRSW